jgi:hypothetical protein
LLNAFAPQAVCRETKFAQWSEFDIRIPSDITHIANVKFKAPLENHMVASGPLIPTFA